MLTLEKFEPALPPRSLRGRLLPDFLRPEPAEPEEIVSDLPKVDPTQDAIDAELALKQQATANLGELLAQIERSWTSDIAAFVDRFSRTTSESVAALLPNLMSEFGAAQIAAAVVAVIEKAQVQAPVLMLSANDHDEVLDELSALGLSTRIELRKSDDQAPGTASLQWEQGGADLDLRDFHSAARQVLGQDATPAKNGEQEQ